MTGPDFKTLLKTRAEMISAIYDNGNNAEAIEFDTLCDSHSDYLWEIVHEKNS